MELLDYRYADEKVRTMAVAAVERLLSNDELHNYLLQLVQVSFSLILVILLTVRPNKVKNVFLVLLLPSHFAKHKVNCLVISSSR